MPLEPIDLLHLGNERVIGVYVVETPEGPALFDCGPATCFERLREAVDLREIRHLLLSHIHLDHAGAAGHVVAANPQIRVHVSEIGAPHVVDPSRLIASARRLYGDELDRLYGEPLPVPQENVQVIWDSAAGLKSFATPGHASHHVELPARRRHAARGRRDGRPHPPGRARRPARASAGDRPRGVGRDVRRDPAPSARAAGADPLRRRLGRRGRRGARRADARLSRACGPSACAAGWARRSSSQPRAPTSRRARAKAQARTSRAAPFNQSYLGLERYWRKKRERDAEAAASA